MKFSIAQGATKTGVGKDSLAEWQPMQWHCSHFLSFLSSFPPTSQRPAVAVGWPTPHFLKSVVATFLVATVRPWWFLAILEGNLGSASVTTMNTAKVEEEGRDHCFSPSPKLTVDSIPIICSSKLQWKTSSALTWTRMVWSVLKK